MQEEKGTTEDEMVGWHQRLEGHEFEQALGDGDGQGRRVLKYMQYFVNSTFYTYNKLHILTSKCKFYYISTC